MTGALLLSLVTSLVGRVYARPKINKQAHIPGVVVVGLTLTELVHPMILV